MAYLGAWVNCIGVWHPSILVPLRQNCRMATGYSALEFETERLKIRAWRVEDAEEAFEMYGDPEVARYLTGTPEESVESQRANLSKIIAAYSRMDMGLGSFPVFKRRTGSLVGAVLLKPLPRSTDLESWRTFRDNPEAVPQVHEIEIGWHLRRSEWGHGYATESAVRMMDYGLTEVGLPEIYAILYKENTASAAVAERLGMRPLGATDRFYGIEAQLYVKP